MNIIIYKTIESKLMDDWLALWKVSSYANYTNSPQWFSSVIKSFDYKEYAIIAIYQKEQLVAVGALVKIKKYGVDFYIVAPEDFVCGIPFLVDLNSSPVVGEMTKQLLKLGNIFLSNIPDEFVNELHSHTQKLSAMCQAKNYYLPITKDENGKVMLRKRNKLLHEIKGDEEKFTIRSFDGKSPENLDLVFNLDNLSSKQGRGYNTFASSHIKKLYKILAENYGEQFCFNILYFENKPIAYEIGFMIGDNYFGSQMAYSLEYKHFSPGKVILVKLIDQLGSKNVRYLDLGSGENSVKQLITSEKRELYQVILSQHIFVRKYNQKIENIKSYAFAQSRRHVKIYSAYRKIKKSLSHN